MKDTHKCCLTTAQESCQVLLSSLSDFPGKCQKKKSVCACEVLSQNKTSSPFPLLPHPACCRPPQNIFCTVRPFSRTLSLQAWRGQMKSWLTSMSLFFCLCSWHKSKRRRRKKNLLAQGSGLFIFLPAATCYPLRGSRKTSHGLGWSDMSNPNCRPGPSQWITTLSKTYYIYIHIYIRRYIFFKLR